MWKFIFSGILLVSTFGLVGQEPEIVLLEQGPAFSFRYLQANYNSFRLAQSILSGPKNSQEIQVELGIHKKFTVVADIGQASTIRGKTYNYESHGTYWRAGIDANMSSDPESGNFIGMGIRYARASFNDKISYDKSTDDWEGETLEQNLNYSNPKLESEWVELVFKMRVKIWKQLYTGYTLRYQFFNQLNNGNETLNTFDIPGYGKTTIANSFGFDYYVGWRMNFK